MRRIRHLLIHLFCTCAPVSTMESNESLTSYLKSMFVQFHGEEQLPAVPSPAPAVISSESRRSSESASIKSMTVEEDSSSQMLENITSFKLSEASPSPPTSTSDETDINNNDKESALKDSTSPQLMMTNGSSTIEVNVDVHHSANHNDSIDAINSSVQEEGDQSSSQKTVSHNKIALTFLDELKENLQVKDDGKTGEETSVMEKEAGDTTAEETKDSWEGGVSQEEATSSPPSVVQSGGSSLRDDEASTAESGIGQEDLEEQWSGQTSSGSSSSSTIESNFSNTAPSSSNRLVRSASSTLFSSSNGVSNGGRRVVLRSISQDVRFKLESIKEEKKVTKSHVSELANFWKGKMISPKDSS